MKTKRKIFGIPIALLVIGVLLIGGVSATLLAYFGTKTAEVTVEPAIVLTGDSQSTITAVGSETRYSDVANIESNTVNDLEVVFSNDCDPDCVGITITNRAELSVVGASGAGDPFESQYYKSTDYLSPVNSLSDVTGVKYNFKIISSDMANTLAPYVVIVGDGIGDYDVAVQMIPDGETYSVGEEYTKTLEGATFHIPASATCNQVTPCTLAEIKTAYPSANVDKIRLALGAWTGTDDTTEITISMGMATINGVQANHKSLKVYGESSIPSMEKYEFAPLTSGTYTITTTVDIAE